MGLTKVIGCVSLVPAVLALVLRTHIPWQATAVLSWIAATGAIVATCASDALCTKSTWLLGKSTVTGRCSPASLLLWWPYHLGLRTKLYVQRRVSTEPLYDKIQPGLYLGGWPESAGKLPKVSQLAVVDVTCELPKMHPHKYLLLPVWDTQAPSVEQIQKAVEWCTRERAAGRDVYIHCAHGHGRSATVMSALLIALGEASNEQEAVTIQKAARPRVRLNKVQAAALRAWLAWRGGAKQQCAPMAS